MSENTQPKYSIIVAYRNRPEHLKKFLSSLGKAIANVNKDNWEVVLVDLGDDDQDAERALTDLPFRVNYCFAPLNGAFWKARALNAGVKESKGEFITILDVDMLVPDNFCKVTEEFYSSPGNTNTKLSYRVKLYDEASSKQIICACKKSGEPAPEPVFRYAYDSWEGNPIGNSQCTLLKANFLSLNGIDEGFRQYGLEDIHFNMRHFLAYGPTTMCENTDLIHLWHRNEEGWGGDREKNLSYFRKAKAENFPTHERDASWGCLPFLYKDDGTPRPLLSILIATMPCRKPYLDRLLERLNQQIKENIDDVELLIDAEEGTTGAKRQRLVNKATGVFVSFIDDDDEISDSYCSLILDAIESDDMPDCIGFMQDRRLDGRYLGRAKYSIHCEWQSVNKGSVKWHRPTTHICPIAKYIAEKVSYEDKTRGEDYSYAKAIAPFVSKEVFIDDILYIYQRRSNKGNC